jgi:phosphate uptake regulator
MGGPGAAMEGVRDARIRPLVHARRPDHDQPLDMAGLLSPRCRELIRQMDELACVMWRRAADCWRQRDGSAGPALAEADDELDELHASLMAELASGKMAPPVMMEMTLVARFYERLGDHAVNIARRVIYLAGSTHARPLTASR